MAGKIKTKYKHIEFELINDYWYCYNRKTKAGLGHVLWYKAWKKYVFEMRHDIVFDVCCLEDVIHFMKQLNK